MMTLHLGVMDVPYATGGITTAGVAQILEDKYGVMDGFVFLYEPEIHDALDDSVAGAIESLMAGAPPDIDPFGSGTSKIEKLFRDYLDKEETNLIGATGVPTAAALAGKSKRFKRNSGPPRPSFIDTGLYQASFKAWVD